MTNKIKPNKKYKDSCILQTYIVKSSRTMRKYIVLSQFAFQILNTLYFIMDHYTIFIEKVKEYNKSNDLADAINQAMEVCIAEGVLADVLSKQKREGQNVVLTEFDQEKYDEMIKEIGREEGRLDICCKFVAQKRMSLEEALEECRVSKEEFLKRMEELGLTLPE